MKTLLHIVLFIGIIAGSTAAPKAPFNKGVNFSNWFQESSVNLVGFTKYTKQDFLNVKGMGADAIRLPVNFYAMTSGSPDYTVSPLLFTMLDTVVAWAEEEEMYLILDNHSHDPSFNAHPDLKNILSKMWMQIADHYKDRSQYLLYEIINEPAGFSDAVWADMMQTVVADIRTKDTVHTIVVSPLEWSSYSKLSALPMFADKNLLYTIHFYGPFLFTHQGADWVGLDSLVGLPFPYGASPMPAVATKYNGTWVENDLNIYNKGGTVQRIKEQIGIAMKFANTRNVPLWCGEFGVYSPKVVPEQRVFWYDTVSKILESQGIAWTIWGYHYGFGIFNTLTWGSFEHDVNIPLVEALGLTPPSQTPYVKKTETSELVIYDDYLAPGIHNVSLTSGQVNMYNEKQPATGRYSISATRFKIQDAISFLFLKDKDLSQLKDQGYALEFKLRTGYAGKFAIRFLDTKTSATDRPWRAQATVSVNMTTNPSQDWQTISIPLRDFKDAGAWDAKWYSPEGKFDWTAIEKFEIAASFASFGDTLLYFDQIRIRIPGSPEPEVVVPVKSITPDAGVVEPISTDPIITPPIEVVVIPEPEIIPSTAEVIVPVPVVTPPVEIVVIPEPVIPPTEEIIVSEPIEPKPIEIAVEPKPVVTPPVETVVIPEPEVIPPTEEIIVSEPIEPQPIEIAVEPEPVVTPPVETVVIPEPEVIPPTEEIIVTKPIEPQPIEIAVEPEVTPPVETVDIPEIVEHDSIVKLRPEQILVPKPVVDVPAEQIIVSEPIAETPIEIPEVEEETDETTELVLIPKKIADVKTEVVITLQPAPEQSEMIETPDSIDAEKTLPTDDAEAITEGTGEFAPIIDSLIVAEVARDTIRVNVTIVDAPDASLSDSSLGQGSGSIKQMVTTTQEEKSSEPYYFRLDNGWLIVESQQEVTEIKILDTSLRLMRKEEGTNKVLLDLPSANYFVIVRFADGTEIIKSAHF